MAEPTIPVQDTGHDDLIHRILPVDPLPQLFKFRRLIAVLRPHFLQLPPPVLIQRVNGVQHGCNPVQLSLGCRCLCKHGGHAHAAHQQTKDPTHGHGKRSVQVKVHTRTAPVLDAPSMGSPHLGFLLFFVDQLPQGKEFIAKSRCCAQVQFYLAMLAYFLFAL
ncbi:MAG TPA: hypothetical protein PLY76_09575 [Flavobacteriales bacterium]|nr:hypothetical protein [Flavobacteriales bacterium]HRO39720.1 hypothetical protein [Flavobacteriales bacterium]HRP82137.1 hypothetical protein [Flavobacteriales bacterium]